MFEFLFKYPLELFRKGAVSFGGPFQLELRLLVAIVLATAIVWFYRRMPAHVGRGRFWTIVACRVLAVAALFFVLFPPVLYTRDVRVQDRFVAVLVDDSRSMTVADAEGNVPRLDAARKIVFGSGKKDAPAAETGLARQVGGLCGVRVFRFADDVERLSGPEQLKGQGPTTDFFAALKGVDEKLRGTPLSAVVIVSDGNHNTAGDPMSAAGMLKARRIPVFTVGLGSLTPRPDYEVVSVSAPRIVRRKSSVDVVAVVRSVGHTEPYSVVLRRDKEVLAQARVTPRSASDIQTITLPVFLEREGSYTYTLEIPPAEGELIAANNKRDFKIDVEEKRLPVLYIEGSPRPEFRFLRGALFEDEDFRIVSVLRLGQGRFLVQGSGDIGLQKGYPTTEEQLFGYEAIIFGDIEASFFTKQQLEMTERFVSERGGGFLMLGGVNSFNLGGYRGTPIEKLLPVRLAADSVPYDPRQIKIEVAEGGTTHPIMHQTADPVANRNIWNTVSPLMGHNPVAGVKSGAVALMQSNVGNEPILAVQDYGIGRSSAFTTGGSWFWRMNRPADDTLQPKFWKQMIRWLAMGSKPKLSLDMKTAYARGEPVDVVATVLGKSLEPLNDAVVRARIEDPFGQVEELPLEWMLSREGVYEGAYTPHESGEHKLVVTARSGDKDKPDSLKIETTFIVGESTVEFSPAWQNGSFLRELSRATGGASFTETDVAGLAERVEESVRKAADSQAESVPHDLWDMPVVFLALMLSFSVEWLLRRRSGLP